MRLIEPNQKPADKDSLQKIFQSIKKLLAFDSADEHAEEMIVTQLMRGLDNRFVLLHNLQLEAGREVFPPILIGPTGLLVLNISFAKGFFKAKEESWWEMSKSSHRFGPGHPNLIKQSQFYAQKLANILDAYGKSHPEITPVLIFANPGVHVETASPAIRIVLMDGVESLITSMLKGEEYLKSNEINYLADSLELMANPEKAIPQGEGDDFFGRDLQIRDEKSSRKVPKVPKVTIPDEFSPPLVEEKLRFSQKQWILLAVLLIITILVLLGAILYALNYYHA
jgi:hypothetical protein